MNENKTTFDEKIIYEGREHHLMFITILPKVLLMWLSRLLLSVFATS